MDAWNVLVLPPFRFEFPGKQRWSFSRLERKILDVLQGTHFNFGGNCTKNQFYLCLSSDWCGVLVDNAGEISLVAHLLSKVRFQASALTLVTLTTPPTIIMIIIIITGCELFPGAPHGSDGVPRGSRPRVHHFPVSPSTAGPQTGMNFRQLL